MIGHILNYCTDSNYVIPLYPFSGEIVQMVNTVVSNYDNEY